MKSLKKITLVTLFAIAFASCSKQREIAPKAEEMSKEAVQTFKRGSGPNASFQDYGGTNYGCWLPAIECLPEVVLTPNTSLTTAFRAIQSGNGNAIRTAFTNNKAELLNYMNEGAIDGVINSTLDVTMKGDYTDAKFFVLFKDASTQVPYETYPFQN